MIEFSTESDSATTSMIVTSQFSVLPPVLKILPANEVKMALGSNSPRLVFPSSLAPMTTMKAIGIIV